MNSTFSDLKNRVLLSKRTADSFTHYLTMKRESQTTFLAACEILLTIILIVKY